MTRNARAILSTVACLLLLGAPGWLEAQQSTDSADVATTIERFHAALAAGDSATALSLLADDVVVMESGAFETRAEYRAHHLQSDIAFARAVRSARTPTHVQVRGDIAWTSSSSTTVGTYRERPVNTAGAELVVLHRTPAGWRIAAIHWSSRQRRS